MQEKKIYHIMVGSLATNCWVYPLDNVTGYPAGLIPCAVIDPGEEGDRIIAFLDQHRLFPSYIILTHGHFDHIGAVSAVAKEYRGRYGGAEKSVTIAIHEEDADYLGPDSVPLQQHSIKSALGDLTYINTQLEPQSSADMLLKEGDTIGQLTVLHLPGHTPGSIALWDKEAKVMFTGDTLFCGGYGRTDLPGGNSRLFHASLTRLLAMDGDIQAYPGHDGVTTIGREADEMRN
jgi:glyoxylase-like metal-dependent hydrolase (beta-lactamase superfamily II)